MQIERDGIRFYARAAKVCRDRKTQDMFTKLAADEVNHLEKLEMAYDNLAEHKEWLVGKDLLDSEPKKMKDLELFEEDISGEDLSEEEALKRGIKAEEDSIRLYKNAHESFEGQEGGEIFKWLLEFERQHLQTLKKALKNRSD